MKYAKTKLISAAMMLAISLVVLAGASMAWISVSTNPEIGGIQVNIYTDIALKVSKTNDMEDFEQAIRIGEEFEQYAPLKPVSTADGVNWFLPTYDAEGKLQSADMFILDTKLEYANVILPQSEEEGILTSKEYFELSQKGYYVYTDFWLMTEEDGGVEVSLSIPDDMDNLESWEKKDDSEYGQKYGGLYGSYAMANYELAEEGVNTVARMDNFVQTALRVGFMELDENGQNTDNFTIWEPNADQRSAAENKPVNKFDTAHYENENKETVSERYTDTYVEGGYMLNEHGSDQLTAPSVWGVSPGEGRELFIYNYANNYYIPTSPIGILQDGSYGPVNIPASRLMVQLGCAWDLTKLQNTIIKGERPSSLDIASFGRFVADSTNLTLTQYDARHKTIAQSGVSLQAASNTIIVELEPDTPKQIRMLIWIEGQDPDCWNDISGGSFIINMEFAARSK